MNNNIDYNRYESKSGNELKSLNSEILNKKEKTYPEYLRTPYHFFELKVKSIIKNNTNVLDLCCGNGKHSIFSAKCGGNVIGLDIVKSSIKVAKQKAKLNKVEKNTNFYVEDINKLKFEDNSFDLVTCLGSLSYVDINVFINEVKRVLKPDGKLIIVDSLDDNIIFKINRFLQVLLNKRSLSTFKRMPDSKVINEINRNFHKLEMEYFNFFIWTIPVLKLFMKANKIKKFMDFLDKKFVLFPKLAFKFVLISQNKK